jgi:hypothetical protein
MELMQYEVTLPADYDMDIIRRRVMHRGPRTDHFPGLGIKAYLIRECGRHGSPVNEYAPFYLWTESFGRDQFVFGPGFDGIRTDFGRPPVRSWHGIAVCDGPATGSVTVEATRTVRDIGRDANLPSLASSLVDETLQAARTPGVNCVAAGIDPFTWQSVRFTLWATDVPDQAPGERFLVLHVSQPHRADLLPGRKW